MDEVIFSIGMRLEELERLVILKAMKHFRGNKMTTAASLGIDRRTLDHRLEKYAVDEDKAKERQYDDQRKREEFLARARGNPPNNLGIPYDAYQHNASGNAAVRMEPSVNFTPKQSMPLSERPEVQKVLPQETSKGGKKR